MPDPSVDISEVWFIIPANRAVIEGGAKLVATPEQGYFPLGMIVAAFGLSVGTPLWIALVVIMSIQKSPDLLQVIVGGAVGTALMGVGLVLALRGGNRSFSRNQELLRNGKVIYGEALGCIVWPRITTDGTTPIWLRYHFESPESGRDITRYRRWSQLVLLFPASFRFVSPRKGQTIAILYISDGQYEVL